MRLSSPWLGILLAVAVVASSVPASAQAPSGDAWVESRYRLAFETFTDLAAEGDVSVHRLTLDGRRYDADDLREAHAALLATGGPAAADGFIRTVEALFADSFKANLDAAFPGSTVAAPTATLDRTTLQAARDGAPTDPPVEVALATTVALDLATFGAEGASAEDMDALLDVGARFDVPLVLFADPGHRNSFAITFPTGITVEDLGGARIAGPVEVVVHNLDGTVPETESRTVRLGKGVLPATATTGRIEVVVDIKDLDVTLTGAAGGDFGRMIIEVVGTAALDTIRLNEDAARSLPSGVHLEALDAEGVRTLVARGFVAAEDIDRAGDDLVERLAARLEDGLGSAPASLEGGFVEATILPDGDGPVRFEVRAALERPLAGGASTNGAAIALYTLTQSMPFERIEGLDTTYRVVLPPGIAAGGATTDGGEVETRTRDDGRDEVVLTLAGEDAPDQATMEMQVAVTPTFVLLKFWPIVLGAVLLVVLVVGGVGWGVWRAVRKR